MSFGFPAYSTVSRKFPLDQEHLIDLVGEALKSLAYSYEQPAPNRFVARTSFGFWSFGERVSVVIDLDGSMTAHSECLLPTQCLDWGKNGRNVNAIVEYIAAACDVAGTNALAGNAT